VQAEKIETQNIGEKRKKPAGQKRNAAKKPRKK
jgi:hypothetical protein